MPGAPRGVAACRCCASCAAVAPQPVSWRCPSPPSGPPAPGLRADAGSRARAAAAGRARMLTMLAARRAQVAAGWSTGEFAAAAAAALDDGVAEPQTLQRVAAARGLPPPAA